ncbi:tyrosine-type recombinase/integrase [Bradyrhizobium sp. HKCCYLS3077]|uniref:tyrosine-type recombinase/integrase n=1 Tax=Bradyrhizobium sp. HKCCYLS3077 TaxID=3420761 RepID=UPI003EB9E374
MPTERLTQKFVSQLRAPHPSGKQVIYFDTETKGFGVQVSGTTTAIDYVAQRDLPNRTRGARKQTRRVNLGPVNGKVLTLEVARQRAEEALDQIRRGVDPRAKAEPEPAEAMYTLRQAKEKYFLLNKKLSQGSKRTYGHHVERHLADWLDKPLSSITPDMVEERHQKIASDIARGGRYDGRTSANDAMNTLRVLWRWAARRVTLPPCPVGRLQDEDQWFPRQRRTSRVSAEQMPAFYQAVCALENRAARDLLLLLTFTGFRKTEAARIKWADVDLVQRVITLPAPNTKTKKTVELPMSTFVHDLLVARRALGHESDYVFPGGKAGRPISDTQRHFARVKQASGVAVSAHSLRRTFLKVGASARVNIVWLKVLCNHALPADVTAEHYLAPDVEDLREPAQQVCDKLLSLCGFEVVAEPKVTKLR